MVRRLVAALALALPLGVLAPVGAPLVGVEIVAADDGPIILRGIKDGQIGSWYIFPEGVFFIPDGG